MTATPDFAARAERARREGDPGAALEIARSGLVETPRHTAGRIAAGLALLDLGRVSEARSELESIVHLPALEPAIETPLAGLGEDELEHAFDQAAAEPDSMVDAEGIALQTVADVERDEWNAGPELPSEAFRTQSMARLLEEQGDDAGAKAIRRSLEGTADTPPSATPPEIETQAKDEEPRSTGRAPRRTRKSASKSRVEVLERWLHNVRRGRA